jgi:hypothetical protein
MPVFDVFLDYLDDGSTWWWSDLASCLSKKLMIYLGFPTEPKKPEARRTDFSRYFRHLDNPSFFTIFADTRKLGSLTGLHGGG